MFYHINISRLNIKEVFISLNKFKLKYTVIYILFLFASPSLFAQASFSSNTDFTAGSRPFYVASADINSDGKPDLVVVNSSSNSVSVFLNTTPPGASTPSYSAATDFTTGTNPVAVAIADINGDGMPDMVTANLGGDSISVFFNTTSPGASTPSFSTKTDFYAVPYPSSIILADVNNDGLPDIVVASTYNGSITVFYNETSRGSSAPLFTFVSSFQTGVNPTSIVAADFNGDDKVDLAVANYSSNSISVLLNNTSPGAITPSFSAKTDFTTGTNPESITAVDLNGDGKPDLATANYSSGNISVLFNTTSPGATTPSFSAKTDFTSGTGTHSITAADINDDGMPDLISANYVSGNISVFLNTTSLGASTPSFSARTDYSTGIYPYSVAATDINGDGKVDLAAANYVGNSVSVLLNTTKVGISSPSFSSEQQYSTILNPEMVFPADLNGDGKKDLVLVPDGASEFWFQFNTGSSSPPYAYPAFASTAGYQYAFAYFFAIADLNGDGKPDLAMSLAGNGQSYIKILDNLTSPGGTTFPFLSSGFSTIVTGGSNPESIAAADFNGDGKVDLATANYTGGNISVLLNNTSRGDTIFTFSAPANFTAGYNPKSIVAADLNNDGKPDLAVALQGSNTVSVFLNTTAPGASTPTFSARTDFTTGSSPTDVIACDINGDGKKDLIVANSGSNTVSVFLNTTTPGASTPSFSTRTDLTTGSGPESVSAADLNGDGKVDLAVANFSSNTISVFLNTTSPGSSTPSFSTRTDLATGSNPYTVAAVDLNGDGKPELIAANLNSQYLSFYLNISALPLPVELTTFTATSTSSGSTDSTSTGSAAVILKWETATEVNCYGFDVERQMTNDLLTNDNVSLSSLINGHWKKIGFVKGAGNSNSPKNYSFTDDNPLNGQVEYRLKQIDNDGSYKYSKIVKIESILIPKEFTLYQNYPNPFNPSTTIKYDLPKPSKVMLTVYNILGQEVAELVNREQQAGIYKVEFNTQQTTNHKQLASGVYIYRLHAGNYSAVKKLVLLK